MDDVKDSIKKNEGFRDKVYEDSLGYKTVGYGFLTSALTPDELAINGGKIEPMSPEVADKILDLKLKKLKAELNEIFYWVKDKPDILQDALLEMAYQLGISKMINFKNTLNAIKENEYDLAIGGLKNSLWYVQTPKRVNNLIKVLETIKQRVNLLMQVSKAIKE